jgi:hypothetical protein
MLITNQLLYQLSYASIDLDLVLLQMIEIASSVRDEMLQN